MAFSDNIIGKKIPKNFDRDSVAGVKNDTGIYVGIVKDNLSPARDGRLRVWIPTKALRQRALKSISLGRYATPIFNDII